ncbi:ubiquitin-conjugating enzyme E2 R [Angomonas deanei]|uniref:Ubiquitin-conjugating enzyme, putative n=1 Tax=Angomonas deanei TaxID=59799 RepID=A0A7G2CBN8_9TRYP|nr:ubiquitin-conjugating enzyme E2 R [Angomonas deanei]CAD2216344.1 Ubiquitin-conjugating enzyme, putative [Angomonas deanei]|eukprot:EPY28249.1 ubiquitin-conjugating enzyme E2 R [Angomonas deanei]
MEPPEFRVLSSFWHPNVYNKGEDNGKVCISILHPPGEDERNTLETAMMRWTPVQTMRSVFISILSLLSEPDPKDAGAPANVDALVMFRNNRAEYDKKCHELAAKSVTELPPDFEPVQMEEKNELQKKDDELHYEEDDDDFFESLKTKPVLQGKARYKDELNQIRATGMGAQFSDDAILDMLQETRGDIAVVIERLL